MINGLPGNLDRRGGTFVARGIMDFPKFGAEKGILMRKDSSRIGGFMSVNDGFPGGILADEILTPGEGRSGPLIVTGGNPLITMANSNRLKKAFGQLDLLVTLDILPTETAMAGTHILPCTTPLERPDLPFVFPLMLGLQTRPYLQATKAVVKPEGEQRDEASIYLDLARASGKPVFGSRIAQMLMQFMMWLNSIGRKEIYRRSLPQEFLLNVLLRITRQKSFKGLLRDRHGLLVGEHKEQDFLSNRMVTPDKRINLAPERLVKQADKLDNDFQKELMEKNKFKLITRRAVTTHNSWTHNFEEFVSGPRNTNYVYIHPEDAKELGLKAGDLADVSSRTATIRIPVLLDADLGSGVIALPHGWGHQASGMQVAKKTKGVNVNILAADGPENLEAVSGMANLTGFVVEIRKSSELQASDSWSGLPEQGEVL